MLYEKLEDYELKELEYLVSTSFSSAKKYAEAYIKLYVRQILKKYSDLGEFFIEDGKWGFSGVFEGDKHKDFEDLETFINKWDKYLKLTETPMKII